MVVKGHASFLQQRAMACPCKPAFLEAEFKNGMGSILVGGNIPTIDEWIAWPLIIQHMEKNLNTGAKLRSDKEPEYWGQVEI